MRVVELLVIVTVFLLEGSSATTADSISGHIRYYGNDAPVAGVEIDLVGTTPTTTTTDAQGAFSFTGLTSDDWQVVPHSALAPADGVSALDAAFALLHADGLVTLSAESSMACDVDASGVVDDADANAILDFRVGLAPLPAATLCSAHWLFVPVPSAAVNQTETPPAVTAVSCEPGSISYTPLSGDVLNQDFVALVFGDCSGNWPGGPPPSTPTPTTTQTPTLTRTPTLSPTPTAAMTPIPGSCAGFSDSFTGTELAPGWNVLNGSGVASDVSDGALHLTPTSGGAPNMWYNSNEAGLVYKPLTGDFTVVATAHARSTSNPADPPPAQYRLGGILALDPASAVGARNWVHVAVGAGDLATPVAVEDKTTSSGSSNFLVYGLPSADAEIRITRTGSTFALYYRQVGAGTWILARQHDHPEMPATVWVGMMVYAAAAPADVQVTFDQIDCM